LTHEEADYYMAREIAVIEATPAKPNGRGFSDAVGHRAVAPETTGTCSFSIVELAPKPGCHPVAVNSSRMPDLCSEALGGARTRFRCFLFPVLRRRRRLQRVDQPPRDVEYFVNRLIEGRFVCTRGGIEATQLSHELQSGGVDLLVSGGRIEIEERFDVSAHSARRPYFTSNVSSQEKRDQSGDGSRPCAFARLCFAEVIGALETLLDNVSSCP
jgi:hypothetical protein